VLELRRLVFMEAAESAARGQRVLMAAADTSKPLSSLESDPMDYVGLTKVHVVASLDTIKALDNVSTTLMEQTFALFELRFKVDEWQREAEQATAELQELNARRQYLVALASAEREPPVGFATLQPPAAEQVRLYGQMLQGLDELAQAILARRAAAEDAHSEQGIALWLRCFDASITYGKAMAAAAVAVRRELEQFGGFDGAAYERHVAELSERAVKAVRDLVTRVTAQGHSVPPGGGAR
jgi:hypothetical protein